MIQNLNLVFTCVLLFVAKASADPAYATLKIELINANIYSPNNGVFQLLQLYFNLASDDQNIAAATYEELIDAKYHDWYINQDLTIKNAIPESQGGLSTDGILFNSLVDISNTPEIQLSIDVRLTHFPKDSLNEKDLSLDFDRSATQKVAYTVCNGTWPATPPQENTMQWDSYHNTHDNTVYDTLTYRVSIDCSSDCYANYTRSLLTTAAAIELAFMKAQIHTPNDAQFLLQIYFHFMVLNDIIASAAYETIVNVTENGGIQQDLNQNNDIAETHGGLPIDGVLNAFVDISNTPEIQLVIDIRVSNFVTGTWDYKGVDFSFNFERTINHSVPYAVRNGTWPPQIVTLNWDSIYNDSRGQLDNFTYSFSITCLSECYEHYIHPPTTTVTTVETTTITPSTVTTATTITTTSATTSAATTGFHTEATTTASETTVLVTGSEEPLRPSSSRGNTGFLVALVVLVIFIVAQAVLLVSAFVKGHKFWPLFKRKNRKLHDGKLNGMKLQPTVMMSDQQAPANDNYTEITEVKKRKTSNVPKIPAASRPQISNEYEESGKPYANGDEYSQLDDKQRLSDLYAPIVKYRKNDDVVDDANCRTSESKENPLYDTA